MHAVFAPSTKPQAEKDTIIEVTVSGESESSSQGHLILGGLYLIYVAMVGLSKFGVFCSRYFHSRRQMLLQQPQHLHVRAHAYARYA